MSENGTPEAMTTKPASEEEVREALYDVVDPELGID
ncbi:metal-sulfur cluster biosynthetic enzyme, partial [Streptomyces albidoflavus]